jgi:hypothetical protein
VGDPDVDGAGLLGRRRGQRRCLLDRGGRVLDPGGHTGRVHGQEDGDGGCGGEGDAGRGQAEQTPSATDLAQAPLVRHAGGRNP